MGVKPVFLFSVQAGRGGDDDYWAEDFNTNKNCQQEKKIAELNKEVGVPLKIVFCSYRALKKLLQKKKLLH